MFGLLAWSSCIWLKPSFILCQRYILKLSRVQKPTTYRYFLFFFQTFFSQSINRSKTKSQGQFNPWEKRKIQKSRLSPSRLFMSLTAHLPTIIKEHEKPSRSISLPGLQQMIKELQDQILKLKKDSKIREDEFTKKKQTYEQIISDLQAENQKLRKFIDDQPYSSTPSLEHSPIAEMQENEMSPQRTKQGPSQGSQIHAYNATQLQRQNAELKKELQQLSRSYQQQIEQMSIYFHRIKQAYLDKIVQPKSITQSQDRQSRKIQSNFSKIYDKMLKEFGEQRKKYISKIEELVAYISGLEEKEQKYQDDINRLRIQAQIMNEELKMYKRIR